MEKIETDLLSSDISSGSYNSSTNWSPPEHGLGSSDKVVLNTDNPLELLKIDDTSKLNHVSDRSTCSICHKSRKYYCYSCCVPLESTQSAIPIVQELPLKVDIIKHKREIDGKVSRAFSRVLYILNFNY